MSLPPAVTVHGLDDALRALAAADGSLTLVSAPGAALYAGCSWWMAVMAQARAAFPQARFVDLLDCGDAAGRALAALRIGQAGLILLPDTPGFARVASIAAAQGRLLLAERPPALDLAEPRARRRLHDWLRRPQGPPQ